MSLSNPVLCVWEGQCSSLYVYTVILSLLGLKENEKHRKCWILEMHQVNMFLCFIYQLVFL